MSISLRNQRDVMSISLGNQRDVMSTISDIKERCRLEIEIKEM